MYEKVGIAKGQEMDIKRIEEGRMKEGIFRPFSIRSYPFAIPLFSYPFSVFSSGMIKGGEVHTKSRLKRLIGLRTC